MVTPAPPPAIPSAAISPAGPAPIMATWVLGIIIPGCASWRRPGIHTPDRGYGFRVSLVSLAPRNDDFKITVLQLHASPRRGLANILLRLLERALQRSGR